MDEAYLNSIYKRKQALMFALGVQSFLKTCSLREALKIYLDTYKEKYDENSLRSQINMVRTIKYRLRGYSESVNEILSDESSPLYLQCLTQINHDYEAFKLGASSVFPEIDLEDKIRAKYIAYIELNEKSAKLLK